MERRLRALAGVTLAVVVAAACGAKPEALEAARTRDARPQVVAAGPLAGGPSQGPATAGEAPGAPAVEPGDQAATGAAPAAGSGATGAGPGGAVAAQPTGAPTSAPRAATPAQAPSAPTVGVTDTEIRFGIHVPETISGINIGAILKLRQLSESYWRYTNEVKGGVNGRQVKAIIADDGYDVGKALQACRDLIAQKVFFISGTGGADQIVACAQYVTKQGFLYTSLGVSEAGLVGNPNYFAFTITYDKQGPLMAKFIVNRLGGKTKKVAMVRFNSPNADGGHKNFVDTYKRLAGKGLVVDDAVDKQGNQSELTAECVKLQQAGAQIVTLLAAPTVTGQLAQACLAQGYHPQWVAWANSLGCTVKAPFGGPGMDGCLGFQVAHHPTAVNTQVQRDCHAGWEKYQGSSSFPDDGETFCTLFDFYRAALTQAGRNLTSASFRETLRQMRYDNGFGNPIQMGPDQIGSAAVTVWRYDANTQQAKETNGFASDF